MVPRGDVVQGNNGMRFSIEDDRRDAEAQEHVFGCVIVALSREFHVAVIDVFAGREQLFDCVEKRAFLTAPTKTAAARVVMPVDTVQ